MKNFLRIIIYLLSFFLIPFSYASPLPLSLEIGDKVRSRKISLMIYEGKTTTHLPLIIINHGYGLKNSNYSFIATALTQKGYTVVSIQHDLDTDPPLPRSGNIFERRLPFWKQGVQNIKVVLEKLKNSMPSLNLEKIILIGHSNGGDIS